MSLKTLRCCWKPSLHMFNCSVCPSFQSLLHCSCGRKTTCCCCDAFSANDDCFTASGCMTVWLRLCLRCGPICSTQTCLLHLDDDIGWRQCFKTFCKTNKGDIYKGPGLRKAKTFLSLMLMSPWFCPFGAEVISSGFFILITMSLVSSSWTFNPLNSPSGAAWRRWFRKKKIVTAVGYVSFRGKVRHSCKCFDGRIYGCRTSRW